ncbi:hypothetical protein [Mucilaginibacter myungsuensis]|uniref:Uncharacterized protein n=1 Tax=Mucilaginibacter myungsuensis TaxID=649104 RepID=A0A929L1R0_9SPHI|nr:hypothetical protein [Mucilaginibacter myungsuensis]MBE9664660.1 hypothetical protein [Mucilaginibacter myungsuensis]MDN3601134.1 hypothetical protein [Mucilaginibacter myungsuensis]
MGAVKINFSDSWYQDLQTSSGDALASFQQILADNESIRAQLQNYHSDEDGAPIVPSYDIISADFDPIKNTGQVRFAYHVEFTFACADKRAETRHTETSNFTIDPADQTLTVFIHDKISRDSFEEF